MADVLGCERDGPLPPARDVALCSSGWKPQSFCTTKSPSLTNYHRWCFSKELAGSQVAHEESFGPRLACVGAAEERMTIHEFPLGNNYMYPTK